MGSFRSYQSLVKLQPRYPEFAVEDLPLSRTSALVPEFAMKDLPLGRKLDEIDINNFLISFV